jgi:two-component system, NtrC family, sensor kinase
MRTNLLLLLLLIVPAFAMAQNDSYLTSSTQLQADSMKLVLSSTSDDTLSMSFSRKLGLYYLEIKKDSAIYFFKQQISLAEKLKLKLWAADGYALLTYATTKSGDFIGSLNALLKGLNIAEDKDCEKNIWRITRFSSNRDPHGARLLVLANLHLQGGHLYRATRKIEDERSNYLKCLLLSEEIGDPTFSHFGAHMLGQTYLKLNKLDSALLFEEKALAYSDQSGYRMYRGEIFEHTGNIYYKKGMYDSAKEYFYRGIQTNQEQNNLPFSANIYVLLADLFRNTGNIDSSLIYGKRALEIYQHVGELPGILSSYKSLSSSYKSQNNLDSAFYYQELAFAANDSLNAPEKISQFQNIGFDEQLRINELEKERIEKENKMRIYALLAGIAVVLLIAFLLYRNNRNRRKANELLTAQKEEIEVQKKSVEHALSDLKSTQAQLIQSEKMASLGELTAGIAHEIQNPLNFVNNFSELNGELIEELNEEIELGNYEDVKDIAKDIAGNEEKIKHHGKRAEEIVKGMLQHSRSGDGVKEPTDINALCDEYLRLSYHGFRAKDKTFNATIKTEFDDAIGMVEVVPQDMGRVILNLLNNAFYACTDRSDSTSAERSVSTGADPGLSARAKRSHSAGTVPSRSTVNEEKPHPTDSYEPTVSVSTKLKKNKFEIRIVDNGNGIPQEVLNKVFQPFFTTKPTGQGTGLGLSLSYDIVNAHGGRLKVETKDGEGSVFIIELPLA